MCLVPTLKLGTFLNCKDTRGLVTGLKRKKKNKELMRSWKDSAPKLGAIHQ